MCFPQKAVLGLFTLAETRALQAAVLVCQRSPNAAAGTCYTGCSSMAFKEFSEDPCVIVHVSCRRMRKFNKEMTFFFIVKQNVG